MKKKTTRKRMAKQQNSVSENFIVRLRHSRKSQLASMLVLAVGLVGIYLVMAAFTPSNYGANLDRRSALDSRGESLRERFGLRVSDTFNRLNFIISRKKDNPEWVQPVILPAPSEEAQQTLPDPTIFGSPEEQFIANLPEESREAIQQETESAPAPAPTPAPQPVPSEDTSTPSGGSTSSAAQPLGEACVYEKEYEA